MNSNLNIGPTEKMAKKPTPKNKKRGAFKSILRILRGDFLIEKLSKEVTAMIFISVILCIFYINNRYNAQQQLIEINKLKTELEDTKYNALTKKAILLNQSRQSVIEDELKKKGSNIKTPNTPPYIIK